jgi:2-haloacid dehalogenase
VSVPIAERRVIPDALGHCRGRLDAKYQWNWENPTVLVFDVNETLIDFESMNPHFEKLFGDRRVLREWFGHLIMDSTTITLSGLYKDFFSLGQGILQMLGNVTASL